MLNPRLTHLPDYAFPRLRALLKDVTPGGEVVDMTIGEPRHGAPAFVSRILGEDGALYGKYPPIAGTDEWAAAVTGWLTRRYGLKDGQVTADHVLPLVGTREGLFSIAFVVIPPEVDGRRPAVLMPNPFYQCYTAAAHAAGADAVYVPAGPDTGFLPDFHALPDDVKARTKLVYLCSPANPQGAVADAAYLQRLITWVRAQDAVLVADECYSEIYSGVPPVGVLQVCAQMTGSGDPFRNVLAFHSLSKRSSLPGLRSGFVAGDITLMAAFRRFRSYAGPTTPIPVLTAAAACWNDEDHVAANRALYQRKFDLADQILSGRLGYYRPEGGFFLWLDVEDGERAALTLWRQAGVRVLPGAYLAQTDASGINPGRAYVRVALVDDLETTEKGLLAVRRHLAP